MTDPPLPNVHRNEIIRIAELATTADVLRELVFEDCEIVGPAVLLILGSTQLLESSIDGPNAVWDLDPNRGYIGGIGIEACLFQRCVFRRVGFGGHPDLIAQLRASLGPNSSPR